MNSQFFSAPHPTPTSLKEIGINVLDEIKKKYNCPTAIGSFLEAFFLAYSLFLRY